MRRDQFDNPYPEGRACFECRGKEAAGLTVQGSDPDRAARDQPKEGGRAANIGPDGSIWFQGQSDRGGRDEPVGGSLHRQIRLVNQNLHPPPPRRAFRPAEGLVVILLRRKFTSLWPQNLTVVIA